MKKGEKCPDLLGLDENGNELRISQFKGRKVVIYVYPKDSTPGCTAEACSLRDGMEELRAIGYEVIGVSKDSAKSHLNFIAKQNLNFHLIADTELTLIKQFGAWGEKKMYGKTTMGVIRTTYLIDENGTVEHVIAKVDTKNAAQQILQLHKG
ncbi:MAG: thioredoxin-dependent thiol peroxidase [Bacteroidales bacterium]|nr:thioredoxin-dependent thiol peroxidase [Bacteroidales bacterium]